MFSTTKNSTIKNFINSKLLFLKKKPLRIAFNSKKSFSSKFNQFSQLSPLTTLSPLDGRYSSSIESLRNYYSEAGLIKYRTIVEIEWLKFLLTNIFTEKDLANKYHLHQSDISSTLQRLDTIIKDFDLDSASIVKNIESETNHDVKAVEYFIKREMKSRNINESLYELVHFCCTSEDINNLAWSLMIKDSLSNVYHPKLNLLLNKISSLSEELHDIPMISRTHGQPATPTTIGKEFGNFAFRVSEQHYKLKSLKFKGKMNGAVGNFNAHFSVLPNVNWFNQSKIFIERLGLEFNPYTTQIENHDSIAEVLNYTALINTILIGFSRDMWGYISLNYFKQKLKKNEVGSSTMPHKVNPIDFENAEGNLGLANALFNHMSSKLPISRFQRDLSDSTVIRNIGTAYGYSILSFASLMKGLEKLQVNTEVIESDLDSHWELLAEPLQTVMRFHGYENPYELLKELTRGKQFTKEEYTRFVEDKLVKLPDDVKKGLKELKPSTYLGNAKYMAKNVREFLK
jgi:adenylosuccinate lyase